MPAASSKIEHLANVPLFANCTKKDLKELAGLCDEVTVAAGKEIVRQGSTSFDCYVVQSGTVKVEVDGQLVTTLGPGAHFGEFAPIDKRPRSATVSAVTETTLIVLGPRQFTAALDRIPGLAMKLLASLSTRLRESNGMRFSH